MNQSLIEKLEAIQKEATQGHWTLEQVYATLKEHGINLQSGELSMEEMAKVSGGQQSDLDAMLRTILDYAKFVDEMDHYVEGHKAGYDKSWAVYNAKERIKNPLVLEEALRKIDEIWSRKA